MADDTPKPGMRDISHKVNSLRVATASAIVSMNPETVAAVRQGRAPKGDPLAVARVAATQAAKNTPSFIPYCHPIPVEHVSVDFDVRDNEIECSVTVKAVYKTGVEVEAMAAAAIGALNIYDLLKPIDDGIEIAGVKLISKTGGKSDWLCDGGFTACIVTVSDRCAVDAMADASGPVLAAGVLRHGGVLHQRVIVPDEPQQILDCLVRMTSENPPDLILLTGGTGVGPRDRTPEAVIPLLQIRLPGIEEHFRIYSTERVPTGMLSRCVAGVVGQTVVIALPGSPSACKDGIECLFPAIIHSFSMLKGQGHG